MFCGYHLAHAKLPFGGGGTLGLDKSTRPARGNCVSGIDGIGHGGDEDEEREGIQSCKAKLKHVF